jgi:Na+-translocating ferredoxin:NAD+ oxidoreductase RnfD subunit
MPEEETMEKVEVKDVPEAKKIPEVNKVSLLQKFYRFDIYITIIVVLSILAAINMLTIPAFEIMKTLPQIVIAVVVATIAEALWDRYKLKKWQYSKSAIITGLFIGSLLDPGQTVFIPALAAIIAILSKIFFRAKMRHFFNPTLFSLFIITLISSIARNFASSSTGTIIEAIIPNSVSIGWWSSANMLATLALGLFISIKFRRLGLTLPFLLVYFVISVLMNPSVITPNSLMTSLLNVLNDTALMFFVFFMLVEPKTSPFSGRGRLIYGPVVAILFFAVGMILPQLLVSTGLLLDQTAATILIGNLIAWIMNWKMI